MRVARKTQYLILAAVVLSGSLGAAPRRQASVAAQETVTRLQKALERLPYYGVFDFLAFSVDRGTATRFRQIPRSLCLRTIANTSAIPV